MAVRKIVKIDEEKCNGCAECVPACAEGAIQIVDGKARLLAENLCDGLGACLGECPEDAITIEERDADDFDEVAVTEHLHGAGQPAEPPPMAHVDHGHGHAGCPSAKVLHFEERAAGGAGGQGHVSGASELRQWPIQLHLVPPTAPYFEGADVLLAADCVAFSMGDFHARHLKGKALAIACPKLDQGMEVYLDKLVAMIDHSGINTLTVMVMEVPCCFGLVQLAREATVRATRKVPIRVVKIGLRGEVLADDWTMTTAAMPSGSVSLA
jgi:Pyruvate/2-oxoacid:ferredoxin oxidoreductase delta subunit